MVEPDAWADRLSQLIASLPDPDVEREVIETCRPLARSIARKFAGRGEPLEDLEQAAMVGLVQAVAGADPSRPESFLAYATTSMTGHLRHHFRDRASPVRIPRTLRRRAAEVYDATDRLGQRLGRSPTVAEIAEETGLSMEEIIEARTVGAGAASIDALPDHAVGPVGPDEIEFVTEWSALAPGIAGLSDRERRILYLRFFESLTQREIAEQLEISQVHVSRLLADTLERLRRTAAV